MDTGDAFPKHKVHGLAGWFDAYFEVSFLGKSWRGHGNCIHIGKLWKLVETAHGNLFFTRFVETVNLQISGKKI